MMSWKQSLGNAVVKCLPATRAYRVKAWVYRVAGFDIAPSARLVSSVRIFGTFRLSVGVDSFLGHDVLITGGNCTINIGSFVDIAPRVTIVAGTHQIDMINEHSAGGGYSRNVIIEDGVWIGAGAIILGGVTIGRKSVIAAGSVVTSDIPAYTMAAGVPCVPKKLWQIDEQQWVRLNAA